MDAASFQKRTEDAATVIQRKFRDKHCPSSDESISTELSSTLSNEKENDKGITNSDDEADNAENDQQFYTTLALAIFGLGMFVYKMLMKCLGNGNDVGMDDANAALNVMSGGSGPNGSAPQPPP